MGGGAIFGGNMVSKFVGLITCTQVIDVTTFGQIQKVKPSFTGINLKDVACSNIWQSRKD